MRFACMSVFASLPFASQGKAVCLKNRMRIAIQRLASTSFDFVGLLQLRMPCEGSCGTTVYLAFCSKFGVV